MKTKFTLACLLFNTMLMAQVNNNPISVIGQIDGIWSMSVIPLELSYNEDNRICIAQFDEDENLTVWQSTTMIFNALKH